MEDKPRPGCFVFDMRDSKTSAFHGAANMKATRSHRGVLI